MTTINDRHPNFRSKSGKLYLVRCFNCNPKYGKENYSLSVSSGRCAWCGWSDNVRNEDVEAISEES